jgi:hypothetical protein
VIINLNLIAATTTATGLAVKSKLDTNTYPAGLKVSDQQMASSPGETNFMATGTTVSCPEVETVIS